ncbi:MAG: V-type ATP synthase subunit B, partial [Solobacterium sp.]|nr:V-type ATP synthase subunit B [Solobacterium sp.]
MSLQLLGLDEIQGSLVALDHVKNVSNEEMVSILLNNGSRRKGRVVEIEGERAIIQVFEGTDGLGKTNTKTKLLG